MSLLDGGAFTLSLLGLIVLLATLGRAPRAGLAMLLELWTAAALLRLSDGAGWADLAFAGAIVSLRVAAVVTKRFAAAEGRRALKIDVR